MRFGLQAPDEVLSAALEALEAYGPEKKRLMRLLATPARDWTRDDGKFVLRELLGVTATKQEETPDVA